MTVVRKKNREKRPLSSAQVKILKSSLRQFLGLSLTRPTHRKTTQLNSYFLKDALDSRWLNS